MLTDGCTYGKDISKHPSAVCFGKNGCWAASHSRFTQIALYGARLVATTIANTAIQLTDWGWLVGSALTDTGCLVSHVCKNIKHSANGYKGAGWARARMATDSREKSIATRSLPRARLLWMNFFHWSNAARSAKAVGVGYGGYAHWASAKCVRINQQSIRELKTHFLSQW